MSMTHFFMVFVNPSPNLLLALLVEGKEEEELGGGQAGGDPAGHVESRRGDVTHFRSFYQH